MHSETHHFLAGDIIFREGEESDAVWIVESGRIELVKVDAVGTAVRLSVLGRGESFGEDGVLDRGVRNFTARAESDVILRMIPASEFLKAVQTDPTSALKLMTQLARRQRDSDERLVRGDIDFTDPVVSASRDLVAFTGPPAPTSPPGVPSWETRRRQGSFFARLAALFRPSAAAKRRRKRNRARTVMVTPLSLEAEYDQRTYFIETISGLDHMSVKPSTNPLFAPALGTPVYGSVASQARARRMLDEEDADLLVWGGETADGHMIEIRFCTASLPVGDRAVGLPPDQPLFLPSDFDGRWAPLLRTCILTAFANGLQPLFSTDDGVSLVTLTDQAEDVVMNPPDAMDPLAMAHVLATYGYVAATAATCLRRPDLHDKAADAWRQALARMEGFTGNRPSFPRAWRGGARTWRA